MKAPLYRTAFALLVVALAVGCASRGPRQTSGPDRFLDKSITKMVLSPDTPQEQVYEGKALDEFMMRFAPGTIDEMEMESVSYSETGYIIIDHRRCPVRYAEVSGLEYPGVLVIQGRNYTIRLRQYR